MKKMKTYKVPVELAKSFEDFLDVSLLAFTAEEVKRFTKDEKQVLKLVRSWSANSKKKFETEAEKRELKQRLDRIVVNF